MKEEETSYPMNFLISISPDGRIESINSFGGSAEAGDEAGKIKNLFKATVQSRSLSKEIHDRSAANVLVSVFPDGRFSTFRVSNTPLEDWDLNWHKSQYEKLMAAYLGDPDSKAISDVEIAPEDPEAEKKIAVVEKMGEVIPVRPIVGKNCNPASPNGASPELPGKFAGWFGNARKIPLSKDDADFNEKKVALAAAGFSFSREENLWSRP